MLFSDILNKKAQALRPEFDRLFDLIIQNQTHYGDALLIRVNGFYSPEVSNWTNIPEKLSPYVIGPNKEGLSDHLHYKFIHNYRTTLIAKLSFPEYLKELEYSPEKSKDIDAYTELEGNSIQLEMLIYLKIWEADAFIKKLYQTVRLLHGEPYDWHFRIKESNRDSDATGTRENIIRLKIRDRLQQHLPELYKAFKNAYLTQVRNSIAHSNYSFLGRNIHLNNDIPKDPAAQLVNLPFDRWIDMFHDTMIIYNEALRLSNRINEYYGNIASRNNNIVELRINRKYPSESQVFMDVKYRKEYKDWNWRRNEENS